MQHTIESSAVAGPDRLVLQFGRAKSTGLCDSYSHSYFIATAQRQ